MYIALRGKKNYMLFCVRFLFVFLGSDFVNVLGLSVVISVVVVVVVVVLL